MSASGGDDVDDEDDNGAAAGTDEDAAPPPPGLVELPIADVLDLHSFQPREVPDLVRDYLDAAWDKGLRELRIIHGRGTGMQRQTVRTLLARDPRVQGFGDAPAHAGGWGATWVRLGDSLSSRHGRVP
ncbi:MAG: Smr/MutS family protein [Acidobacteriota bacterium]|nr:Smr/MutS family protein [Acidobacteriota bacterium]